MFEISSNKRPSHKEFLSAHTMYGPNETHTVLLTMQPYDIVGGKILNFRFFVQTFSKYLEKNPIFRVILNYSDWI